MFYPDKQNKMPKTDKTLLRIGRKLWDRMIFDRISKDTKQAILSLDYIVSNYDSNELVIKTGARIEHICVVISGVLKSTDYTKEGKELNSSYFFGDDVLPGGDAFPFYLVYSDEKIYSFSTICFKKATVVWIPVDGLLPIIAADPVFSHNILKFVSHYTNYSKSMLRCVQYRRVEDRLAYWLCVMHEKNTVKIPNSQEVLGDMLHVNRSTINQVLKKMAEHDLITLKRREIIVKNRAKLLEFL